MTRQPNGVIMKHSPQKSTLFAPIIVSRQSETSLHGVQEESADVSRSMAAILFETNDHVTRTSCDVPLHSRYAVVHLQKRCVVIFERVSRQDEHLNSLVRYVSSLSMCHNNMQYSYPELCVPEFALPISTSSFLAVISQRSSVTTYDTWKS